MLLLKLFKNLIERIAASQEAKLEAVIREGEKAKLERIKAEKIQAEINVIAEANAKIRNEAESIKEIFSRTIDMTQKMIAQENKLTPYSYKVQYLGSLWREEQRALRRAEKKAAQARDPDFIAKKARAKAEKRARKKAESQDAAKRKAKRQSRKRNKAIHQAREEAEAKAFYISQAKAELNEISKHYPIVDGALSFNGLTFSVDIKVLSIKKLLKEASKNKYVWNENNSGKLTGLARAYIRHEMTDYDTDIRKVPMEFRDEFRDVYHHFINTKIDESYGGLERRIQKLLDRLGFHGYTAP